MVNELMKLTLLLCIVVGPILFAGEILLARIRRTACRSLRNIHIDPAYSALLYASAAARSPAGRPQSVRGAAAPAGAGGMSLLHPTTDH